MRASPPWQPDFAQGPWFAPVAAPAAALAAFATWPSVGELDRALAPWLVAAGVRLVASAPLVWRAGELVTPEIYELRVADDHEVPTRSASWHDLLNALQWAAFPQAKQALTARLATFQRARAAARTAAGPGGRMPGTRHPDHDRLALLDEGGLIVLASAAAVGADGDALAAAVATGAAAVLIFGHALLEHALSGDRTVRAAPVVLEVQALAAAPAARRAAADSALAAALTGETWRPRAPGWPIDDRWLCSAE